MQVRNAKPTANAYKLADGGGLYLGVMPTGAKHWRMKYRQANGKENRLAFGTYPETSLSEARDARTKARKLLNAGATRARSGTTKAGLPQKRLRIPLKKSRANGIRINSAAGARTPPKPHCTGSKPISSPRSAARRSKITHKELIAALRKIEARGAQDVARRLKATCSQVFSYGIQSGLTERNPAADMKDVLKPAVKGHFAAISADELPAFLQALGRNEARMLKPTRIALRLMLVLMTALVAAFALVPLLLAADAPGKETLHPAAVVIFGGLISSTLLDTLLTPLVFWLVGKAPLERLLQDQGIEAYYLKTGLAVTPVPKFAAPEWRMKQ